MFTWHVFHKIKVLLTEIIAYQENLLANTWEGIQIKIIGERKQMVCCIFSFFSDPKSNSSCKSQIDLATFASFQATRNWHAAIGLCLQIFLGKRKKDKLYIRRTFYGKSSHWIEEERNEGKSSCKFVDFKLLTGNWNNLDFSIKESSQLLGKRYSC